MISIINVNNNQLLYWLYQTEKLNLSGTQPNRVRGFTMNNYETVKEYAISEEYLKLRLENAANGTIEHSYNKLIGETEGGKYLLDNLNKLIKYDSFYTSGYDPKGFVGWHSDSDISGYYISLVYQTKGTGILRNRNPVDGTIEDSIQNEGWNIFAHKLGSNEKDAVWHCAVSDEPRYTFLVKFNTEEQQLNAIKIMEGK